MRSIVALFGAVLLTAGAAACSSTTAPATVVTFTADLLPRNEIPLVVSADAAGSGSVTLVMAVTEDGAGNVLDASASLSGTLTGFPPGTHVTMAQVRYGATGSSGSVALDAGLGAGEVVLTTGSGSFNKEGLHVRPTDAASIMNSPATHYFTIQTALTPSGAARGQLIRR
jgi:hypothetical protein